MSSAYSDITHQAKRRALASASVDSDSDDSETTTSRRSRIAEDKDNEVVLADAAAGANADDFIDQRDADYDAADFELLDAEALAEAGMDVDELLRLVDSAPAVKEMDDAELRAGLARLQRAADANLMARAKHPDEPLKFLPSELDLDEAVKALAGLATEPALFPVFASLRGPALLAQLLTHENLDIGLGAAGLLSELLDDTALTAPAPQERAAAWALAGALAGDGALTALCAFLLRLDESVSEHAKGAAAVLTLFYAIISAAAEVSSAAAAAALAGESAAADTEAVVATAAATASALATECGLVPWLLLRVRYGDVHPYFARAGATGTASNAEAAAHAPATAAAGRHRVRPPAAYAAGAFSETRALAAELLALLLTAPSPSAASGSDAMDLGAAARGAVVAADGLEDLVSAVGPYRRPPPVDPSTGRAAVPAPLEEEFAANLFLALTAALSYPYPAVTVTGASATATATATAPAAAAAQADPVAMFVRAEGLELMLAAARVQCPLMPAALKVIETALDSAAAAALAAEAAADADADADTDAEGSVMDAGAVATRLVEVGAIKTLFPLFVGDLGKRFAVDEAAIASRLMAICTYNIV